MTPRAWEIVTQIPTPSDRHTGMRFLDLCLYSVAYLRSTLALRES
jgi:hypothetical protein